MNASPLVAGTSYPDIAQSPDFGRVACVACAGRDLAPHLSIPYGELMDKPSLDYTALGVGRETLLHLDRCRDCGTVFVNPRYAPERLHTVYNQCKANKYAGSSPTYVPGTPENRAWALKKKLAYLPHLLAVVRAVGNTPLGGLLDYGSGFGFTLSLARELGFSVCGVEVDEYRLNYSRTLGLPVLTPEEFAREGSPFPAGAVVMQSVVEHLQDPAAVFALLARNTAPGAVVYCNAIAPELIAQEMAKGELKYSHFLEHLNFYPRSALDRLLERFGFAYEPGAEDDPGAVFYHRFYRRKD